MQIILHIPSKKMAMYAWMYLIYIRLTYTFMLKHPCLSMCV